MSVIFGQPKKGEIWRVKLSSGRTWLFESAWNGHVHITEHQGAYCYNDGGDDNFTDAISIYNGYHIGDNYNIIELKPANENEVAIFKRKLRR